LLCGFYQWQNCVDSDKHALNCHEVQDVVDAVTECVAAGEHGMEQGTVSTAYVEGVCGHYYPTEDPKECAATFIACEAPSNCAEKDHTGSITNLIPCVMDDAFMTCNVQEMSVTGCEKNFPVAQWGECLLCGFHQWKVCQENDKHALNCHEVQEVMDAVTACVAAGEHGMEQATVDTAYVEGVCGHYYPTEDPKECATDFLSCESQTGCAEKDAYGAITNLLPCVTDDAFMTCNVVEMGVTGCQKHFPVDEWGECLACGFYNWQTCQDNGKHALNCHEVQDMVDSVTECVNADNHGMHITTTTTTTTISLPPCKAAKVAQKAKIASLKALREQIKEMKAQMKTAKAEVRAARSARKEAC
jgi:hypothetical protein